ncbi:Nitroreductase [Desulfacinum hydrothermale DSM 13146]|uniref:Nitroreductase n=1 Tax=Desulfacinum hydrothermale DSM 13146 TaxID=1121390 RepID=A0A1W1XPX4_9BACT|nr:nitroreductase family protein [Desulfacinum hydrothermale]SMC25946.1 Nitroreductase [Desulfacinum hydrothermale DSM 13146]
MELERAIRGRRSIRKYEEREVPREVLREVIDLALWAPSGMNRQEWEIVVVQGTMRDRLLEVVSRSQDHIMPHLQELFSEKIIKISLQVFKNLGGAPTVMAVYIPESRREIDAATDAKGRYHQEFDRFNRLLSAAALIENLLLAAYEKGLGTCWMTGPKYMEEEINALLGMEGRELVSLIPIGYPDQSPPAPPRKKDVVRWIGSQSS